MTKSSVVITFYIKGIKVNGWSEIFDSTTMSGAARKASTCLRETFHVITEKWRLDNYSYWQCEDVSDLPKSVFNKMLEAESSKQIVDARPFFAKGDKSARMNENGDWAIEGTHK